MKLKLRTSPMRKSVFKWTDYYEMPFTWHILAAIDDDYIVLSGSGKFRLIDEPLETNTVRRWKQ